MKEGATATSDWIHLDATKDESEAAPRGNDPFPVDEDAVGHSACLLDASGVSYHVDEQEGHHVRRCTKRLHHPAKTKRHRV